MQQTLLNQRKLSAERAKKIQELGIRSKDDVWFENYEVLKKGVCWITNTRDGCKGRKKLISVKIREALKVAKITSSYMETEVNIIRPKLKRNKLKFISCKNYKMNMVPSASASVVMLLQYFERYAE